MFEFVEIEALNYYLEVEDEVIFFFETSWSDECESFLDKLISVHENLKGIPIYRFELDLDGGDYIKRKYGIESAPTLIKFFEGSEEMRITDEDSLYELL